MKTAAATLQQSATPILRVAYQQSFNEEEIRKPLAKVQRLTPAPGLVQPAFSGVQAYWDEAWFAHYE